MIGVETIVECAGWREALPRSEMLAAQTFEAAMAREPRLAGSAALLMTDDQSVRQLNARFRGKDVSTNVLSFPSGDEPPGFLGDIALAFETCLKEAHERGISLSDHAAHLIAHGLLHLVGYDHLEEREARRMEALEVEILDALGVSNPYAAEEQDD